jgi:iron complex transport system ATP-binding protein
LTININNLTAGYGNNTIIRSLFLEIPCSSFVAVIGYNGAGKSTFLKAITNKIAYHGSIVFPTEINKIAMLGQKNQVNFSIKVKDLVLMGLFDKTKLFQSYSTAQMERVMQALQVHHIQHLADLDFLTLSGGEQQLVWLSQLFLQNADVYLFDEPTQYLDIAHTNQIFEIMQTMVIDHRKTIICVTHHIHYLKNTKGYILNLSEENPSLKTISSESIDHAIVQLSKFSDKNLH